MASERTQTDALGRFRMMDWTKEAKLLFNVPKPRHFCNYQHCCECFEHDETLLNFDVDSIGLEQLGNAGWDPLCFCSPEGLKYYLPAMIRLTLNGMSNPPLSYLDQLLFHLIYDGNDNRLVSACSHEQRDFIVRFLEFLIENYDAEIDKGVFFSDDILRAHEIWNAHRSE